MSSVGIDLILSMICLNATFCDYVTDDRVNDVQESFQQARMRKYAAELNGKHLRIGTVQNYPHSTATKNESGILEGGGVAFELVKILADKFNFTYEVVQPARNWEGKTAHLDSSLLGLVQERKVDFAAAFLATFPAYNEKIIFSTALDEGTWAMMMKRPKESASGSGLLAPLEQYVWYLMLVAVAAYGPCIALLTRLQYRLKDYKGEHPIPLNSSVWFVYGATIKQGTTLDPDANPTRILFATWWLFVILLTSFYTANLTAFLTLSKFTLDIEKALDLYTKNYRWTAAEGGAIEFVVTDPNEEMYYLNKMIKQNRVVFKSITDKREFLQDVDTGIVLVEDRLSVDYVMYDNYLGKVRQGVEEKERCTYVIIPNYFMRILRAFAFPLNSTLPTLFNPVLQAIVESGTIQYLQNKDLPSTKICPLDLQSKERRLRNSDLSMTYIMAGIGICAAAATFIGEVVIRRYFTIKIHTESTKSQNNLNIQPSFIDDSKPPPYDSIFGLNSQYKKSTTNKRKMINGRDYWVVETINGDVRLIPVRTPSAFLFRSS